MSVRNIFGAEAGDFSELDSTGGTVSITSAIKRSGDYALRCNPTTTATGYGFLRGAAPGDGGVGEIGATAADPAYVRVYIYIETAPAANSEEILSLRDSGQDKFTVRLTSGRLLAAYDDAGSLITTGTTAISLQSWTRIDIHAENGVSSAWDIEIDGIAEISGTSNLGANNYRGLTLGKRTNVNGQTIDVIFDDVVLSNSAAPPPGRVIRMDVDADGSSTDFTIGAGAGSDYQNVDDVPHDDDTTYLLSTNNGAHSSLVGFESCASAGISGTINSVKGMAIAKRDAGANSRVKLRTRSGGVNVTMSNGSNVGASYVSFSQISEVDPFTTIAYTTTDLDSIEFGVLEDDGADKSRITALMLFVDYTPDPPQSGPQVVLVG
jgi:hypothetical protein